MGKFTDKQVTIILLCVVLGFLIIVAGHYLYDFAEVHPNFWSPTNPIITHPYRYLSAILTAFGVFVMILGLPLSSMLQKGKVDSFYLREIYKTYLESVRSFLKEQTIVVKNIIEFERNFPQKAKTT